MTAAIIAAVWLVASVAIGIPLGKALKALARNDPEGAGE